jgi:putative ABC transport system substrate-binding protein
MDRRRFLLTSLAGALAAPVGVRAQGDRGAATWRVGVLWPGAAPPQPPRLEAFREGLREAGFPDGANVAVEVRHGETAERLRVLAAELRRLKVNVIAAIGDLAPRIAHDGATATPIVALADDIMATGLIASLGRPGGVTTGISILSPELSAKRLELLKEIVPHVSRVAALWDPATPSQRRTIEEAARSLKIRLQLLELRGEADVAAAFRAAKHERAEAVNVLASPMLSALYRVIIERAASSRLPVIYQWKEHAEAGGLVSYGPSVAAMWRQTAHIVGKVLKGSKPAELAVEQPTKFELVINAKTAKALGLTIPPSLLARADQVIE